MPFCNAITSSQEKADVIRTFARKLAFNFAMLLGSIGFVMLGNLAVSSVARGELITSVGTQEAAKSRGAQQTAQFGGNAVYVRADYEFPGFGSITNYFSGFLINSTTLGTAGHGFSALAPYNPRFSVGLSADYTKPTFEIPLVMIEYHPSYQGGVGGSGYDLARGQLSYAAPGVSQINFWTGERPGAGTDIFKIGYGLSGTPLGYDFTDRGAARGVFSTLSDLIPNTGNPSLYHVSIVDHNRPDGGRGATGDSGGGGLVWNSQDSRFETAFMQIAASNPAGGFRTELLFLDADARSFLTYSSVPEPSSAALLFTSIGIYTIHRRRKKRQVSASTPQAVTTCRP